MRLHATIAVLAAACAGPGTIEDADPPSAPRISVAPSEPRTGDDVTIVFQEESVDPSGSAVTYGYRWETAGEAVQTEVLSSSATTRGQVWTVTVTPTGSGGVGSPGKAEFSIHNSPPVVDSVVISPDRPSAGAEITCNATGRDGDGDGVIFRYAWEVDGVVLTGQASRTLPAGVVVEGDEVRCTVIPTDGIDDGAAASSGAVTVTNSAPVVGHVTLTPDPARTQDDLSCVATQVTDPDGQTVTLTYAWTVDDVPVAGQDGTGLGEEHFERGQEVACHVTPNDGEQDGPPAVATITISNTPPTLTAPSLGPSDTGTEGTLTCTLGAAADVDGDDTRVSFGWTVDGVEVQGAQSSTLSGITHFDRGDVVVCLTTPNDFVEDGARVASAPVTIVDSPPRVQSVGLSPAPAFTDTVLTCTAVAEDPDGDAATVTSYEWRVDGSVVQQGAQATLDGAAAGDPFSRGQAVTCTATPQAGGLQGAPGTSAALTIANSPPTFTSVAVSPSTPTTVTDLSCVPQGWDDPDGDAEAYRYVWRNGSTVLGGDTPTLGAGATSRGMQITCQATAVDQEDQGTVLTSAAVAVVNSGPPAPSAPTVTAGAAQQDDLVCVPSGAPDPDGDAVTYEAQWELLSYDDVWVKWTAGVQDGAEVGDEVSAADLPSCRSLRCRARATDGEVTSGFGPWSAPAYVDPAPGCDGCYQGSADAGPYSAYGRCFYLGAPGATCDQVCGSFKRANITPNAWNDWPSSCGGADGDDVTTWFRDHGNPHGWSQLSGGTSYRTIGYGYLGSTFYGSCPEGGSLGAGAWPGDPNNHAGRSDVCTCGSRSWEYAADPAPLSSSYLHRTWGNVYRPERDTAVYRAAIRAAIPVGCQVDWDILENDDGDVDGPWSSIASGAVSSATGTRVWHYTPIETVFLLEGGKSYWITFGSSCTWSPGYSQSPTNLDVMGSWLGYCYQADYEGAAPTSPTCFTSRFSFEIAYDVGAEQFPATYSAGTFTVRGTWRGDADLGTEVSDSTADFSWSMHTQTTRSWIPANGATWAVVGRIRPSHEDCAAASLSSAPISANDPSYADLPVGTWLCGRTNLGRLTRVQVVGIETNNNHRLTLDHTTWQ